MEAADAVAMVGVQPVGPEQLAQVGVVAGRPLAPTGAVYACRDFVEKPDAQTARERLVTPGLPEGRYSGALRHLRVRPATAGLPAGAGGRPRDQQRGTRACRRPVDAAGAPPRAISAPPHRGDRVRHRYAGRLRPHVRRLRRELTEQAHRGLPRSRSGRYGRWTQARCVPDAAKGQTPATPDAVLSNDGLLAGAFGLLVGLLAAGHGDDAGAGQLADAVGADQVDEGLQLILGARTAPSTMLVRATSTTRPRNRLTRSTTSGASPAGRGRG